MDGRTTVDGRTPKDEYTMSSPCESEGSGELKIKHHFRQKASELRRPYKEELREPVKIGVLLTAVPALEQLTG